MLYCPCCGHDLRERRQTCCGLPEVAPGMCEFCYERAKPFGGVARCVRVDCDEPRVGERWCRKHQPRAVGRRR